MMKRLLLLFVSVWGLTNMACGQGFDECFEDRTLRLDYIFGGNNRSQQIFFEQAYVLDRWAGRRSRLTEMPLKGNGQIKLSDATTGQLLYVHTFSTLFQEWQVTEEATKVQKAFEASFNVPMPKQPVNVTVTLTDVHGQVVGALSHTIDPADILIRPIGPNGIPFRYIWSTDSVPDITRCIESQDSGPSIPRLQRWSRTPVGSHYDTFYSNRYLMTQDMHRLYDVLSGVPFEHIIVLVNTDIYGGGGIYNQLLVTTSDNAMFRQVLVHEFGHSYAGLGDEYYYDDGYETMYPADTEPWEPNLTTKVDFQSKWADMLPDPTGQVGLFEGGGYQSKGVFRPAQECRMKVNEVENFCPVCSRAIIRITDFYTSH